MNNDSSNTFGNIPYLALPTVALVLIIIGVGLATKRHQDDNKPIVTPTPIVVVPSNCEVIDEDNLFIIMQCTKSNRYKF